MENVQNIQNQQITPTPENKPVKKMKIKRSNIIFAIISSCFLGIVVAIYLFILGWAFMSAFKSDVNWLVDKIGLPTEIVFTNFEVAFKNFSIKVSGITFYIEDMLLNSVLYSIGSVLASIFVTSLVAYCCAKYNQYLICKILYAIVIVVVVLPIVGSLPSAIQMSKAIGFYDNILGIIIQHAGFCNMNFLIFYGAFKGVSKTYSEAAFIDGAGQWSVYFRIILPLVKSSLFAVGLLQFISYWNDFTVSLYYLPSHPVLSFGIQRFLSTGGGTGYVEQGVNNPMRLAIIFLSASPILVLFFCFRKKLMSNITVGGLKG